MKNFKIDQKVNRKNYNKKEQRNHEVTPKSFYRLNKRICNYSCIIGMIIISNLLDSSTSFDPKQKLEELVRFLLRAVEQLRSNVQDTSMKYSNPSLSFIVLVGV